ncbi:hypothetical protein ACX1C1_10685 [Paenibacillus sp. strain BS8-2]
MNKVIGYYLLTLIGVALFAGSVYFIKTIEDPEGALQSLPYLCFGLGCVMFGHGIGEIVVRHAMNKNPAAAKQLVIDKNDERNLAITNRAKAKAFDMMTFVFGALILGISLMGIELIVLLQLVFAYLFVLGYNSFYRYKYYKEM